jgi:hypothetical protein
MQPSARLWQQLEEHLARFQQSLCRSCKGTGMCAACGGNGRILLRDRGSFECRRCCGDGACVGCDGTGKALHA